MDEPIDELAEKVMNYSTNITPCCKGIIIASEANNKKKMKERLKELRNIHYKLGEFLDEMEAHSYDGEIDNG